MFNGLESRLTALKWDHPCTSGQDTYAIDQVFHSFSKFDAEADEDGVNSDSSEL